MTTIRSIVVVALLAVVTGACGSQTDTPTAPSVTAPTTATWWGIHLLPGSVTRSFAATQSGTVTATITTISPTTPTLTLGIGIPQLLESGCTLTRTVPAVAGTTPALTATVDAGTFCLKLYDETGKAVGPLTFSVTLVHP